MKFDTNTVYTIKLNSGEELITKILGEEDGFITIEEPVSIAPTQKGMQFVPSMFTSEPKSTARLNTNSISLYSVTDEGIKMKYIEMTTGITLPEKSIILG
jgi:hypothetical protein